ncbi:MAG TPA: hypothetical protein VGP72_33520 [Planctomycetota bacterium]|jgi:hypothetical protein
MRKFASVFLGMCVFGLVLLCGCKNQESGDYDQVGEQRVFDAPSREIACPNAYNRIRLDEPLPLPSAAASAPLSSVHQRPVKSPAYVHVGDLELE